MITFRILNTFFVFLFFIGIHGMNIPLSSEEKEIFLHIVKLAGIEAIQIQLKNLKKKKAHNPSLAFSIQSNFYVAEAQKEPLIKSVIDAIARHEYIVGYKPNTRKKHKDTLSFLAPNNYLGNYTRYWHEIDKEGGYIICKSSFTNIEALEEIINQLQRNMLMYDSIQKNTDSLTCYLLL